MEFELTLAIVEIEESCGSATDSGSIATSGEEGDGACASGSDTADELELGFELLPVVSSARAASVSAGGVFFLRGPPKRWRSPMRKPRLSGLCLRLPSSPSSSCTSTSFISLTCFGTASLKELASVTSSVREAYALVPGLVTAPVAFSEPSIVYTLSASAAQVCDGDERLALFLRPAAALADASFLAFSSSSFLTRSGLRIVWRR